MNAATFRKARLLARASGLAAFAVSIGGCTTAAVNQNERIGLPQTTATIAIDGIPETAWDKSTKIFLEDGSSNSAAFMRGMADATNIYLYFEAEDPVPVNVSPDTIDAIILAFNPTGMPNDYHRLHIYPCAKLCSPSATGVVPDISHGQRMVTGTTVSWPMTLLSTPPQGMVVKANASIGNTNRWSVELSIPRASFGGFPANNFFALFAMLIPTDFNGAGSAKQYSWPLRTAIGTAPTSSINNNLDSADLPLGRWGTATLDTTNFTSNLEITGFGSGGSDPSKISLTQANRFTATVANAPGGTGNETAASNVTAVFSMSNFGLGAFAWNPIPSGSLSPSGGQTINAREYVPFSWGDWTLNNTEQGLYSTASTAHQCIRVQVFHSSGAPIERQFNMQFVNVNSPFEATPQIATGAWRKKFPRARAVELQELFLNVDPQFRWESQFQGAVQSGEHRWVVQSMANRSETLRSSILAGPTLRLPSQEFRLDPVALSRGSTMDIAVRPGSVLTLLADGEATAGSARYGATGKSDAKSRPRLTLPRNRLLASEAVQDVQLGQFGGFNTTDGIADALRPGSRAADGALIGSFDGFRTAFAIGSSATMFVPVNAQSLSVRFAPGVPYDGGSFVLQAIMSEPTSVALGGYSLETLRAAGVPVLLPLGGNLPMHIVRGTLDTGLMLTVRGQQLRVGVPMGSYGSLIRRVNRPAGASRVDPAPPGEVAGAAPAPSPGQ